MSRKTQRAIVAAAERHGATDCTIEHGSRHYRVSFTRPNGSVVSDTYGTGRVDDYKVAGWVRQLIRNGNQKYHHAR